MRDVTLIDAGTGNLRSVQKALESTGATVVRTDDPAVVRGAARLVLPGVGAFGPFMDGLRRRGLEAAVKEAGARATPLLGICVGMQALFESGEEMGEHAGLGLLRGRVRRFEPSSDFKVPHTGWNQLQPARTSILFSNIASGAYVYFNHSYFCEPEDEADVLARTAYISSYASAVQREKIYGVQFHPEKSQAVGLQILRNFLELA